jgi:hypothetical protein
MSFVNTSFALPSITGKTGAVILPIAPPARCALATKSGIARRQANPRVIRPAVPRTRLTLVRSKDQIALSGFFDSLLNVAKNVTKGIVGGAAGGPVGMVAGGVAGGISSAVKGSKQVQAGVNVVQQQEQLGPLAGISAPALWGIGLGATALIIALARSGGR